MTKQAKKQEFERYAYGSAAAQLASDKASSRYAGGALEVLAGKKGVNLGEEAEGFIIGTLASPKGIQDASENYNGKFNKYRGEIKVGDLGEWYGSTLTGLNATEKAKILAEFDKFKDKNLGAILKKATNASYQLEDPDNNFNKEVKNKATDTLKKYANLLNMMDILDNYKNEEMRPDAVKATRKKDLKNLTSKL